MVEYHIRGLAFELLVLAASDGRHVRRDAGVHDDVVFAFVLPHRQAAEYFEATAEMDLLGNATQDGMEGRQGKCLLVDVAQWLLQRCRGTRQLDLQLRQAQECAKLLKCPKALSISVTCASDSV